MKKLNITSLIVSFLGFLFTLIFILQGIIRPLKIESIFLDCAILAMIFSLIPLTICKLNFNGIISAVLFLVFFVRLFFLPKIFSFAPFEFFVVVIIAGILRIVYESILIHSFCKK